ncbi:MAG TPA: hypothetical protein VIF57_29820 [Polyangia bacterium]|jgi:hypothetical protein
MSRQGDNHFGRQQTPGPASGRMRATDAGMARGPGIVVALVTAAIVFVIGQRLFPVKSRQAPPPAPTVAVNPPPVVPPPPAAVDGGAPAAEAGTTTTEKAVDAAAAATADAARGTAAETEKAEKAEPAEPSKPATGSEGGDATADHKPSEKQDKDLAREAWRRNRPDISIIGNKTAIMVPIRGSIRGANFKVFNKPRTVLVTLPKAVSMVTMPVYNMKHPLFRKVWIDQNEAKAQPNDGTKLRFVLSPQTYDPQVEITDDFVRVTIRRPESGEGASEHTEKRAEKRSARTEKQTEPAEEAPAPAPEKESSD